MSFKYSQELIDRFIKYFKEEKGVLFSEEQAEEALDNLAGLFLAFAKPINSEQASQEVRERLNTQDL